MTDALLDIDRFRYAWPGESQPVLDGLSLRVYQGERVFLAGSSGSGKSTLLALIGGLVAPDAGTIRFAGADLGDLGRAARDRFRADHLGVIFQQFNLLPWLTSIANVRLGCQFSKPRRGRAGDIDAAARRLLTAMDLPENLFERRAGALSVGQQQRVAAARALIGQPDLVLADEPTSALDADRRDSFVRLLFEQAEAAGSAVLFVSHDRVAGAAVRPHAGTGTAPRRRPAGMTLFSLARGSLANRLPAVSLTVLTIAISIGLLVLVEQMRGQVREGFYRSVSGTDLIVGAPTAPVQLLLYSVFGLGNATNNVTWESYRDLASRPVAIGPFRFRSAMRTPASASSAPPTQCWSTTATPGNRRWKSPTGPGSTISMMLCSARVSRKSWATQPATKSYWPTAAATSACSSTTISRLP